MQWFLIVLYLSVCVFLVGVVLMQRGKDSSGDLFGSGASSVLTGQGTTSFLVKLTATLSILFFVLSFFLGLVLNQSADRMRLDDVIKAKEAIVVESQEAAKKTAQVPVTKAPSAKVTNTKAANSKLASNKATKKKS